MYVCMRREKHEVHTESTHTHTQRQTQRHTQTNKKGGTQCGPSVGSVGDKGRRITGGPWGAEQVICLKHEQTEHTPT